MVVERLLHLHDLIEGHRLELAVEQLESGLGFVFNGVWFRKEGLTLNVEAVSPAPHGTLTEDLAHELIGYAQESFSRVCTASAAFNKLAADLPPAFAVIEDYGMGTTILCRLNGDRLIWAIMRPSP